MSSKAIILKTDEEIELMREANRLVGKTLGELSKYIRPGITTLQLDKIADTFIRDHGAIPSFLGYSGFPNSICTSVNECVVHGLPNNMPLKDGDIVSIDVGTKMNGFCGDSAYTFRVGEVSEAVMKLLRTTKESLFKAIHVARQDNRIGDIGYTIQRYCESHGYTVVREMIGHGIGRDMHEAPEVPNYGRRGTGALIKNGMCLAIEPMINMGSKNVVFEKDGWTVRSRDRKPSAHFEHTVAIVNGKADILSTFEYISASQIIQL